MLTLWLCTVPPVLEPAEFQNDVAVVRGSLVFLPCEARGSPLPFVSWVKDGEPLLPQSLEHGPGLLLEAAEAGHAGTYSCVAVSEAGEARRHFQLTVMGESPAPRASFSGLGVEGGPQGGEHNGEGGEGGEHPRGLGLREQVLLTWLQWLGAQILHSPGTVPPHLITQIL